MDQRIDHPFNETDFDRAFSALDLCLQDYTWIPGENNLRLDSLMGAMKAKNITLALTGALLRRLIDRQVFRYWTHTIPAGPLWENGLCHLRSEPETTTCLITTQEKWYAFLKEHKDSRASLQAEPIKDDASPNQSRSTALEEQAIGCLFKYSDWSLGQIAKHLGINQSSLYRWKKFRETAEKIGRIKPRGPKNCYSRRGHKTSDGQLEAYDNDSDDG
jgi:hypothetical protein